MATLVFGGFPKMRGTFLGGSHHKDYSSLGSILGSPLLRETTISMRVLHGMYAGLLCSHCALHGCGALSMRNCMAN